MTLLTPPKAVIFDWDDTIVNTWRIIHAAINTTLQHMEQTPWTDDEARQRIGPPARVLFTALFGEDRWQEADAVFIHAYADSIGGNIRVHEGAEDMLHHGVELRRHFVELPLPVRQERGEFGDGLLVFAIARQLLGELPRRENVHVRAEHDLGDLKPGILHDVHCIFDLAQSRRISTLLED